MKFVAFIVGAILFATNAFAATQAVTAYKFVDSIGVNTHFDYNDPSNAYGNLSNMESELAYTGIRYARDAMGSSGSVTSEKAANAATGVKFDVILDPTLWPSQLSTLSANAKILTEVEGANEIDFWPISYGGQSGYPAGVAFQKAIYSGMKGTSSLATIPINSLSIAESQFVSQVGNLSLYCDYAVSHMYPQWGGTQPVSQDIQWYVAANQPMAPSRPSTATEFGWWTQPMSSGTSPTVQAKLILNYLFDAFRMGLHRSYIYELNDEYNDARGTNQEYHFGLFTYNNVAKPSATALHNLTALLADPTPLPSPASLPYSVSVAKGVTVYSILMQRGDGTFILALWQDAALWDYGRYRAINVASQQALVNFGITAKAVAVYDPTVGVQPVSSYATIGGLTVSVPDHPVLIFLK